MKCGIRFDTDLGNMTVVELDGGIAEVYFSEEESQREFTRKDFEEKETPLLKKAKKELQEYGRGERSAFDLPLNAEGTGFQKTVWEALCTIPYGETRSYKQIAEQVGNPKGSRAVGMANHNNPISIIVPCHRVVGSNGSLTGYAGGMELKKTLLELERGNQTAGGQK